MIEFPFQSLPTIKSTGAAKISYTTRSTEKSRIEAMFGRDMRGSGSGLVLMIHSHVPEETTTDDNVSHRDEINL
jgi:hypothetical protein